MMASITLRGVEKFYGSQQVLYGCDLEIRDREFLVLVGPSGSGKTTILRIIAGLESITSGEVYFDDTLVNNIDVGDRDIAMVFQSYGLYPHMSVFENMAFGLRRRKMPKDEITRRVQSSADLLGIAPMLKRRPKQLSGGQRQRVALGRAIVRDPAVFLLDEPLSNLDAHLRVQMRAEILRVHRAVTATAVYVTHDQVEALTMGDRIAVMNDGRIQQLGTPQELYDHPVNKFVASFIGTPAMGFLDCRVTGGPDGMLLEGPGLRIAMPADRAAVLTKAVLTKAGGDSVTVGIRPEHMKVAPAGQTGDPPPSYLHGLVEVVEPLGSEQHVLVDVGGGKVTARMPRGHAVRTDDKVTFAVDGGLVHAFDAGTGTALL
jgi:multiple sugar transport system ATP-binding protein